MNKDARLLAKFSNIQKFNSQFSKCNVAIAYVGDNRNYTSISKETFENMIPSLYGVPVVGEWKGEDFGSHGGKIEISDEGINYIETTKPYGYVDSQAKVWWEEITEEDGAVNEYLMTECFLWTGRYPEAEKVLEGKSNQSMEILVNEGEYREDGYFDIKSAEFSALCILGETVEPCFQSSGFSQFNLNKDEFKQEFNLMVKELKQSLLEGGENVEKENFEEKEEIIQENFETNEIDEATVDTLPEETKEFTEEKPKENFELSHDDIRNKIFDILNPRNEDGYREWNYWIMEVFQTYVMVSDENETEKYYRFDYTIDENDEITLSNKTEMFLVWLTQEEKDTLEEEKSEFTKLKEDYTKLETEVKDLRQFKADKELEDKTSEIEQVFEKYSTLLSKEDYSDLADKASELSVENLEKELSFRLVQKKFDFSKIAKKDSTKVSIKEVGTDIEPYGSASVYFNK